MESETCFKALPKDSYAGGMQQYKTNWKTWKVIILQVVLLP